MAGEICDQSNRVQAKRLFRMSRLKAAKPRPSANNSPLTKGKAARVSSRFFCALVLGRVEHREELRQMDAQVGTVGLGAVLDEQPEGLALEDAGALREETEEDPHQEAFQLVAGVAARLQGVVQIVHDGDRAEIDRVLVREAVLLVAGDEGERVDVAVQVGQRELDRVDPVSGKQRQRTLFFRLQIVEGKPDKIGDDDVPRHFVLAAVADEVLDILEGLRLGLAQILAAALVFDEQHPLPEEIDPSIPPGNLLDWLLERGQGTAAHAENLEELVPKRLLFGDFASCAGPFRRETYGVLADLVP